MEHPTEDKVVETFGRLAGSSGENPIDLSGPPTLFDV